MAVPERVQAMELLDRVDYGDAFAARCPPDVLARYTSEELGELAMGRAPRWLRALVRGAQGGLLGLRLVTSRLRISLGWPVLSTDTEHTVYRVPGGLITARLVVMKEHDQVLVVFLMRQERPWATPVVALVKPVHRAVARYLLTRGTRLATEQAAPFLAS